LNTRINTREGGISLGKTFITQRDIFSLLLSYESMSFIIKHPKINQSLGIPITPSLPATLEVRQMDMRMLLHKMQQLALIKRCHLAFLAFFFDLWFVHFLCTWLFQDVLLFRLESVQDIMLQTASRRRSRYLLLAFSPASVLVS
jgi:hypothetical protein